jgi:hypothetical protein
MITPRWQSLWRNEHGTAMLECALVLPVLITLLSGVFEFSWFFYQQHLAVIGLRDAASYLTQSSDPCNPSSRDWATEQEHARNLATNGSIAGGTSRIRGWTPKMVTLHCAAIDNPVERSGLSRYRGASVYIVTVYTQFTYQSLGFLDLLKLQSPLISASHSQRAIGYR